MKTRFILGLISIYGTIAQGQENSLYMPLEFQQAYNKQTRSYDGKPGGDYWVNRTVYKINAEIDPKTKILTGEVNIEYTNNSPDTLGGMVIRLYQDMYKKGNIRDRAINEADVTNGVEITKIMVNQNKIDLNKRRESNRFGTNLFVRLHEFLLPNSSVRLTIYWSFKIPEKTLIRMGAIDPSSMFVGYWYPQVSVYDDIDGWDMLDYTNRQEFYTENSDYNVRLTLPADYYVWATGELNNADKIYTKSTLEKINAAKNTDEIISITDGINYGLVTKKGYVTWHFQAKNVPDFAFALSNHYLWDAGSVMVDSSMNKRVLINTVYNEKSKNTFKHVTEYQRQSMLFLSNELPGIAYPYPQFTTFQGLHGGGMEFPMMANNGESINRNIDKARYSNLDLTAHEMAHTYFPFLTGINERKYTWMEEGWATLFGDQAAQTIANKVGIRTHEDMLNTYTGRFLHTEGSIFSVPLMTPSILIREAWGHFHASYYKPYFAYKILQDMLGEDIFKNCLQEYIKRWEGKHPTPYDFFFTFNDVSGENLNWFWKSWFFDFGYPDLAVKSISQKKIIIEKVGALPIPVELKVIYNDNSFELIKYSAKIWNKNPNEFKILATKSIRSVELISNQYPDVNYENNRKTVP